MRDWGEMLVLHSPEIAGSVTDLACVMQVLFGFAAKPITLNACAAFLSVVLCRPRGCIIRRRRLVLMAQRRYLL